MSASQSDAEVLGLYRAAAYFYDQRVLDLRACMGRRCPAFVVYDWLVTLSREVDLFWTDKVRSLSAMLYLANKYLNLLPYIVNGVQMAPMSDKNKSCRVKTTIVFRIFLHLSYVPPVASIDEVRVRVTRKTSIRSFAEGRERFSLRTNPSDCLSSNLSDSLLHLFTRIVAPVSHFRLRQSSLVSLALHRSVYSPVAQPSHVLARGSLLLPSLADLTLGFVVPRSGTLSMSLREGVVSSAVATLFRDCGATFTSVLAERSARGSRLSRLEFFWLEDGCIVEDACPGEDSRVGQVELSGEQVEEALGLEPLRELVDGPVIFAGYRFLAEE
ncbi:hypothetical protein GSI_04519 [Ganoderma sinense ZZ0214-1]|uniref:DUF6533 domain-containing protein n=1 Tax=Ganoderma sinense ZZ0214-1 TaxID=1077348 RepID=A0A2G8SH19_9APHY|nr:hypothetical protein GSI_04519 [Ganoderma sinense ZZ0214-1]